MIRLFALLFLVGGMPAYTLAADPAAEATPAVAPSPSPAPTQTGPIENLVERIFVDSIEQLISAKVTLLFEEKKTNDEDVEVIAPPRVEMRDAVLQKVSENRWEVLIQLQQGDRAKHPMLTCVIITGTGAPLALPNRVLREAGSEIAGATVATLDCVRDPTILSPEEILALTKEERAAFIRSREDDSKKFASELNAALTDEVSAKLFAVERRLGLAPQAPLSRKSTVEEIARRLVALESVWSGEKRER